MRKTQHSAIMLAALLCAGTANAAFYVNEDIPSATALRPDAAKREKTSYVSFAGTRPARSGNDILQAISDDASHADSITVNANARTRAQLVAAKKRVAVVKAWLIKQGVPEAKIQAWSELDPLADATDTDVQVITRSAPYKASPEAVLVRTQTPPATVLPPATRSSTSNVMSEQSRIEFARRITAMAQNKQLSPEDALRLITELLSPQPPLPATTLQTAPQSTPQIVSAQIVPTEEAARTWTLSGNQTLQENLKQWARSAGYNDPDWQVPVAYQVTYTSQLTGTFLQVLAQIANAVPSLDFQVSRTNRSLRVVAAKQ